MGDLLQKIMQIQQQTPQPSATPAFPPSGFDPAAKFSGRLGNQRMMQGTLNPTTDLQDDYQTGQGTLANKYLAGKIPSPSAKDRLSNQRMLQGGSYPYPASFGGKQVMAGPQYPTDPTKIFQALLGIPADTGEDY